MSSSSWTIPLIQAQLDHTSTSSPSLVLIQDSVQLSASLLLREILIRTLERNHQALLCSTLREPSVYLAVRTSRDGLQVIDAHNCTQAYDDDLEDQVISSSEQTADNNRGIQTVFSMKELAFRVRERVRKAGPSAHLTIVIDSLDSLLEQYDSSPSRSYDAVYEFIKVILKTINPHSRLIIVHPLDSTNSFAKSLFSSLLSPLIFSSSNSNPASVEDSAKASSSSGLTSILRLHSPSLPRILLKEFGLLPPTTSDSMLESIKNERQARSREEAKRLEMGNRNGGGVGGDQEKKKKRSNLASNSDEQSDEDPRFWDVLNNVASRGDVHFSTSGSRNVNFEMEEAFSSQESSNVKSSSIKSSSSTLAISSITIDQLKLSSRSDEDPKNHSRWAMIETRSRNRTGKWSEEILGLVRTQNETSGARLSVVGLDMTQSEVHNRRLPWEEDQVQTTVHQNPNPQQSNTKSTSIQSNRNTPLSSNQDQHQDPHSKLVGNLPFNLSETSSQRARRDDVPLPYTFYKQQESQPSNETPKKGNILFEPESEDDEDEDDPDDDLDL